MEAQIGQGRVTEQAGIELGLEEWIEFVSGTEERLFHIEGTDGSSMRREEYWEEG